LCSPTLPSEETANIVLPQWFVMLFANLRGEKAEEYDEE
jgi:hypothetical protein